MDYNAKVICNVDLEDFERAKKVLMKYSTRIYDRDSTSEVYLLLELAYLLKQDNSNEEGCVTNVYGKLKSKKEEIAERIGDFFGYFELNEDGTIDMDNCMNNWHKHFHYETAEEFLLDWYHTIFLNDNRWKDEIYFIHSIILKKLFNFHGEVITYLSEEQKAKLLGKFGEVEKHLKSYLCKY